MAHVKAKRVRRVLFTFAGLFLATLAALLLLEGATNVWRFVRVAWTIHAPLAERSHTEYDDLLGWRNLPSVSIPDLYGPGRALTINSQRFRALREYSTNVPPGKTRVVCAGDSFTLGYGVGDQKTWCHQLTVLEPVLETINIGQGGYGIDQAYLSYERDAQEFDHNLLIFSFINEGFRRMKMANFLGYPKPRLRLDGGVLVRENVPVPRGSLGNPRLAQLAYALNELATYRAVRSLLGAGSEPAAQLDDPEVRHLALAVFEQLAQIAAQRGIVLILVYLPMHMDYDSSASDLLRYFLAAECKKRGLIFLDLVEEFRKLSRGDAHALLDGHYTEAGNRFAAEHLLRGIRDASRSTAAGK